MSGHRPSSSRITHSILPSLIHTTMTSPPAATHSDTQNDDPPLSRVFKAYPAITSAVSLLTGFSLLRYVYGKAFGFPAAVVPQNSTFLVTGASQGMGRHLAIFLTQNNAKCIICVARNRDKLNELQKYLQAVKAECDSNSRIEIRSLDASDYTKVDQLRDELVSKDLVPNVICNVAGAGKFRYLHEESGEHVENCIKAPYLAAAQVSRAFIPSMMEASKKEKRQRKKNRRHFVIAMVQSPAAYTRFPGCTSYIATRYALRGLYEALRADLHETDIAVQEVIFTEVRSNYFENNPGSLERLPWLGLALCGRLSVEEAARDLGDCVICGRTGSFAYSFRLRMFLWMSWLSGIFGECLHALMTHTGWSMEKSRRDTKKEK